MVLMRRAAHSRSPSSPLEHGKALFPITEPVADGVFTALAYLSARVHEEGLWRLSGRADQVAALANAIEDGGLTLEVLELHSGGDAHAVAGAVKRVLRGHEPLIPYSLYNIFCAAGADELATLRKRLPPLSYRVLERLLGHLRSVLAHSEANRMTAPALARVVGMNLARRSEDPGLGDLEATIALFLALLGAESEGAGATAAAGGGGVDLSNGGSGGGGADAASLRAQLAERSVKVSWRKEDRVPGEEELKRLFSAFGAVEHVAMRGRSAAVILPSPAAAAAAVSGYDGPCRVRRMAIRPVDAAAAAAGSNDSGAMGPAAAAAAAGAAEAALTMEAVEAAAAAAAAAATTTSRPPPIASTATAEEAASAATAATAAAAAGGHMPGLGDAPEKDKEPLAADFPELEPKRRALGSSLLLRLKRNSPAGFAALPIAAQLAASPGSPGGPLSPASSAGSGRNGRGSGGSTRAAFFAKAVSRSFRRGRSTGGREENVPPKDTRLEVGQLEDAYPRKSRLEGSLRLGTASKSETPARSRSAHGFRNRDAVAGPAATAAAALSRSSGGGSRGGVSSLSSQAAAKERRVLSAENKGRRAAARVQRSSDVLSVGSASFAATNAAAEAKSETYLAKDFSAAAEGFPASAAAAAAAATTAVPSRAPASPPLAHPASANSKASSKAFSKSSAKVRRGGSLDGARGGAERARVAQKSSATRRRSLSSDRLSAAGRMAMGGLLSYRERRNNQEAHAAAAAAELERQEAAAAATVAAEAGRDTRRASAAEKREADAAVRRGAAAATAAGNSSRFATPAVTASVNAAGAGAAVPLTAMAAVTTVQRGRQPPPLPARPMVTPARAGTVAAAGSLADACKPGGASVAPGASAPLGTEAAVAPGAGTCPPTGPSVIAFSPPLLLQAVGSATARVCDDSGGGCGGSGSGGGHAMPEAAMMAALSAALEELEGERCRADRLQEALEKAQWRAAAAAMERSAESLAIVTAPLRAEDPLADATAEEAAAREPELAAPAAGVQDASSPAALAVAAEKGRAGKLVGQLLEGDLEKDKAARRLIIAQERLVWALQAELETASRIRRSMEEDHRELKVVHQQYLTDLLLWRGRYRRCEHRLRELGEQAQSDAERGDEADVSGGGGDSPALRSAPNLHAHLSSQLSVPPRLQYCRGGQNLGFHQQQERWHFATEVDCSSSGSEWATAAAAKGRRTSGGGLAAQMTSAAGAADCTAAGGRWGWGSNGNASGSGGSGGSGGPRDRSVRSRAVSLQVLERSLAVQRHASAHIEKDVEAARAYFKRASSRGGGSGGGGGDPTEASFAAGGCSSSNDTSLICGDGNSSGTKAPFATATVAPAVTVGGGGSRSGVDPVALILGLQAAGLVSIPPEGSPVPVARSTAGSCAAQQQQQQRHSNTGRGVWRQGEPRTKTQVSEVKAPAAAGGYEPSTPLMRSWMAEKRETTAALLAAGAPARTGRI